MDAVGIRSKILSQSLDYLPTHESFEAQRVADWDRSPLPIQKLVHLEDIDIIPTDRLSVADVDEAKILFHRTHRQNPSRRSTSLVVAPQFVRHCIGHVLEHRLDCGEQMNTGSSTLEHFGHWHLQDPYRRLGVMWRAQHVCKFVHKIL